MLMRTSMSLIIMFEFLLTDSYNQSFGYFELKLYVLTYQMPYYFFMMVTVALLFSAHTFYTSIRELLFPELKDDDGVKAAKKVKKELKGKKEMV